MRRSDLRHHACGWALAENWLAGCIRTMFGAYLPLYFCKLLLLGRSLKGGGRSRPSSNNLGECVEVSGAHEALMLHSLVSVFGFAAEFFLLQARVGSHASVFVSA